jgi:hypothetical protein
MDPAEAGWRAYYLAVRVGRLRPVWGHLVERIHFRLGDVTPGPYRRAMEDYDGMVRACGEESGADLLAQTYVRDWLSRRGRADRRHSAREAEHGSFEALLRGNLDKLTEPG